MPGASGDSLYALGKIVRAVETLATGTGQVRWRVADALTEMTSVREADMPTEELRSLYKTIIGRGTKRSPSPAERKVNGWGSLHATADHTRNSTATKTASLIVQLEIQLRSALYEQVPRAGN